MSPTISVTSVGGSGAGGGILGIVMEHRVNSDGLEPSVPGASGLGGAGVDLSGREADVAAKGQDEDANRVMVLVGEDRKRHV